MAIADRWTSEHAPAAWSIYRYLLFLIIRPQKKRQRKHDEMLARLRRGRSRHRRRLYGTVKDIGRQLHHRDRRRGQGEDLKASIQMKKQDDTRPVSPSSGRRWSSSSIEGRSGLPSEWMPGVRSVFCEGSAAGRLKAAAK